jgi:PhoH-like ATPase
MGKDIGYLPGKEGEKLSPWMHPIFDNLEFLLSNYTTSKKTSMEGKLDSLITSKLVEIASLTFIRGRSLPQQYLIIDEAQNLTPHEAKTIITRAGEGTKIVLTGDAYQIDNPYLDSTSNGLTYIVEKFKDQKIYAHITLAKGERSALAELAANLLN